MWEGLKSYKEESAWSPKEVQWEKTRSEVERINDDVGTGIDEGIKEAVVALMVSGFPTSQSCEGHVSENGANFPWIEIYAPEPKGWETDKEKQREWTIENMKQRQRMNKMLEEFYQGRETPSDTRITFRDIGVFGGFRIQSTGAKTMSLLSPREQRKRGKQYKKEMGDFMKFLRDKYFLG